MKKIILLLALSSLGSKVAAQTASPLDQAKLLQAAEARIRVQDSLTHDLRTRLYMYNSKVNDSYLFVAVGGVSYLIASMFYATAAGQNDQSGRTLGNTFTLLGSASFSYGAYQSVSAIKYMNTNRRDLELRTKAVDKQ